jgi:type IV secretion system protein TrbI
VTDPGGGGGGGGTGRVAAAMRLRPSRPPVTRLSRKVLLGLGIAAAGGIAAALLFALEPRRAPTGSELYNLGNAAGPEGLARLPRDYTALPRPAPAPRLGPPLPGDLGPPIAGAGAPAPPTATNPLAQEQEAALKSQLFVETSYRQMLGAASQSAAAAVPPAPAAAGTAATPAAKDRSLAFLDGPVDRRTVSPDRVEPPASPYVLQAGSVIPAALITGIRSDLPGEVTAQVTENVYDSPSGTVLLIPQGARLVGLYDSQVSFGQSRVLLVWTRLIMPNGHSLVLERQPAADAQGYAGLEDQVDNHWGMLFKAAILSTLLSIGSEAGTSNSENSLVQAIRQGASQGFNQVGEQVVGRSLNVQPTLTIRPGFPVRVLVTRDLVFR